jgi:hypothetical protein
VMPRQHTRVRREEANSSGDVQSGGAAVHAKETLLEVHQHATGRSWYDRTANASVCGVCGGACAWWVPAKMARRTGVTNELGNREMPRSTPKHTHLCQQMACNATRTICRVCKHGGGLGLPLTHGYGGKDTRHARHARHTRHTP